MKALLILVFILFYSDHGLANEAKPSSFVLYYQPLHEFDTNQTTSYLLELRKLLSAPEAGTLHMELIDEKSSKKCHRSSYGSCNEVLYGTLSCIPKKKWVGDYCLKKSRKLSSGYFKDPLFNRIKWNRFSLKINKYCNFKNNAYCKKLAQLHDKYMLTYRHMIQARREMRKQMRK